MYAAAKQPGNLSQSALNYLQSLEKATKALRQGQPAGEKKSMGGQHSLLESSRLSSARGSLSSMISHLRNRTQKESTIDESDSDRSMSDNQSQSSEKTPSIDSHSSASGEVIMLDFPYDVDKEDNKHSDALPKELPGLQMGRKSIHEIRELRSSIDHSLVKPPKLQRQQPRRFSFNSYKEDSDSEQHVESEEEPQNVKSKPNVVKAKSPFRPAIESGSDLESIDFEEATSPTKSVHFEDQAKSVKSSANSSSSRSSTSNSFSSSQSTSSPTSTGSRSSSKSKSKSSSSESSTIKDEFSEVSTGSSTRQASPSPVTQLEEDKSSDSGSRSSDTGVRREKAEKKYSSSGESNRSMSSNSSEAKRKISSSLQKRNSKPQSRSNSLTPQENAAQVSNYSSILLHQQSVEREKTLGGENEDLSRKLTPPSKLATKSSQRGAVDHPHSPSARSSLYRTRTEHSTQTEEERNQGTFPEFCSTNLHCVTRDVLKTHLQLLKEFNRLEFSSLQEWNAILDDVRQKYEGPSTEKLEAVLQKRINKELSMDQV